MIKFCFVGDISLNDAYINLYAHGENPFSEISSVLNQADYVVGNLECIAKGGKGENKLKKPRLTTTTDALNFLKILNINIVSLAHNHVYDHLEDGFNQTTRFLTEKNIQYLGASVNKNEIDKPILIENGGLKIGILNYVTHDTHPSLPSDAGVYLNFFEEEKVKKDIRELKASTDQVVLLLHWGGRLEGGSFPDFNQPAIARRLVDAGADLIIGHHSHTLQPYEVYKGKYIFYSLGNFCFSDILFEGKVIKMNTKKRSESIVVAVNFNKRDYKIEMIPFVNENHYLIKNNTIIRHIKFRQFCFQFIKRFHFLWYAYFLKFKYYNPLYDYFFESDLPLKEKIGKLSYAKLRRYLFK